jgi:hypothetical protein
MEKRMSMHNANQNPRCHNLQVLNTSARQIVSNASFLSIAHEMSENPPTYSSSDYRGASRRRLRGRSLFTFKTRIPWHCNAASMPEGEVSISVLVPPVLASLYSRSLPCASAALAIPLRAANTCSP